MDYLEYRRMLVGDEQGRVVYIGHGLTSILESYF
jgi:hypothetical protein